MRLTKIGISVAGDAMVLLDSVGKSQLDYVTFTGRDCNSYNQVFAVAFNPIG